MLPQQNRISYLDGFRAVAILFVISVHFPFVLQVPGVETVSLRGYLGVDIFSLLSGFVVYSSYRRYVQGQAPDFKTKLKLIWNRLKRIYSLILPISYIVLLYTLTIEQAPFASELLRCLKNFGVLTAGIYDVPYWTLINEIIFYFMSPILIYPFLVDTRYYKMAAFLTLALFLAWYLFFTLPLPLFDKHGHVVHLGGINAFNGFGLIAKNLLWFDGRGMGFERMLLEYLLGTFAAKLFHEKTFNKSAALVGNCLVLSIIGLFFALGFEGDGILVALLAIYFSLSNSHDVPKKILSSWPFKFVAMISYSMYVLHLIVVNLLRQHMTYQEWLRRPVWKQIAWESAYLFAIFGYQHSVLLST